MGNSADDYVLTTCLEFEKYFEGQVLLRGTRKSCEDAIEHFERLGALTYNGDGPVQSSQMLVLPFSFHPVEPGESWRSPKPFLT